MQELGYCQSVKLVKAKERRVQSVSYRSVTRAPFATDSSWMDVLQCLSKNMRWPEPKQAKNYSLGKPNKPERLGTALSTWDRTGRHRAFQLYEDLAKSRPMAIRVINKAVLLGMRSQGYSPNTILAIVVLTPQAVPHLGDLSPINSCPVKESRASHQLTRWTLFRHERIVQTYRDNVISLGLEGL